MNVLRRIGRLMLWVLVAGGAFALFVWSGRFAPLPFRWSDPSGWLREVERDDAFVEAARWLGELVSGYVCASALLALFAEVAAAARHLDRLSTIREPLSASVPPLLNRRYAR